ncbi:MAG: trimeric intracellular cation channel family protein, partial [Erythrobacter sp.]
VAGRPSIIMQPELYVTAAALSAVLTVAGMELASLIGLANAWAWGAAFVAGFVLRAAAIRFELGLPSYGRREAEVALGDQPPKSSSPGSGPPG